MSRERLGRDRACPPSRIDPPRVDRDLARHTAAAPLLRLWRVVGPRALGPATARSLRLVLVGIEPPFGRRHWDAVLRGDPAAMARVSITALRVGGPAGTGADAVASALLMRALAGDRTAPAILAVALRKLARLRPGDAHLPMLAEQWTAWAPRIPAPAPGAPGRHRDAGG